MNAPSPESMADAITLLFGESDQDTPRDCHHHCTHWDTEGECCECGDLRTPNPSYVPTSLEPNYGLIEELEERAKHAEEREVAEWGS